MKKLSNVKPAIISAARDVATIYTDAFERLKHINLRSYIGKAASALAICFAFALFSLLRNGVGNMYMSVFIPIFIADALIILYGEIYCSQSWMSLYIAFLLTAGTALQIFMLPPDSSDTNSQIIKTVMFVFAAIILGLIFTPWLAYICADNRNKRKLRILLIALTVLLYLVLLVFGTETNGTKAWLYLPFNLSLQLTDFIKVITMCVFALCISDNALSEKKKAIVMFSVLCLNALFLVIINELGTLLIIGLILFLLQIIYLKSVKALLAELAIIVVICTVVLGSSYLVYNAVSGSVSQITAEEAARIEAENTRKVNDYLHSQDPNIGYEDLQKDEPANEAKVEENDETSQKPESMPQKVINRYARIYPKISSRFTVLFHSANASQDDTYQIDNAFKALATSDWFGTPRGSLGSVPEINSDFIFIDLVVRIGIIGAALVLLSMAVILIETVIRLRVNHNPCETSLAKAFIFCIVFQSLICCCSNLGIAPIVGLPFAFLSNGGTALTINVLICFFAMYAIRKEPSELYTKKEENA